MPGPYANDFTEIFAILAANQPLRVAVDALAATEAMPGKATEGDQRLVHFRAILRDLIAGNVTLTQAYQLTAQQLPQAQSQHGGSGRVFAAGWEERLVRTQLSRCYNQGVLNMLAAEGITSCFVPHSSAEQANSRCSLELAGQIMKWKSFAVDWFSPTGTAFGVIANLKYLIILTVRIPWCLPVKCL